MNAMKLKWELWENIMLVPFNNPANMDKTPAATQLQNA